MKRAPVRQNRPTKGHWEWRVDSSALGYQGQGTLWVIISQGGQFVIPAIVTDGTYTVSVGGHQPGDDAGRAVSNVVSATFEVAGGRVV